jgi:hypothetical protein
MNQACNLSKSRRWSILLAFEKLMLEWSSAAIGQGPFTVLLRCMTIKQRARLDSSAVIKFS